MVAYYIGTSSGKMTSKQYRFIASFLNGTSNELVITHTRVYDTCLEAFRHCLTKIDQQKDDYCSKMYTAVSDELGKGGTLISVSHKRVGNTLEVCWIQVIDGEAVETPIPPLDLTDVCCIWPVNRV